ncbi:Panacea domain-containing protein [Methylobacterium sp. CM6247]
MWLQKMIYIAHGWNLAVNGEPLVAENPEAWDGGPVYRDIWDHIRDHGIDPSTKLFTDPVSKEVYEADLSAREKSVVDHVWNKYRKYSGRDLSRMTHMPGTPWTEVYLNEGRDSAIPNHLIKQHYTNLALAGRGTK